MEEIRAEAHYMDGQSARVRPVLTHLSLSARAEDSVLIVRVDDQILERWDLISLRERQDQAKTESMVLTSIHAPDARLMISGKDIIAQIRQTAPYLKKSDAGRGAVKKALVWAAGAVAAVFLIVFVIVPTLADQLAEIVPEESERKLGEASINQISWVLGKFGDEVAFCAEPDGVAALDKMVGRLTPEFETGYDLNVRVIDHPLENAFAVPGGQVVLFDGLLKKANSPEEVAGVVGHELGHVVNRDPTRLAFRSAGSVGILGMLVGDFTGGGLILVLTERLIAASYSQDAESSADTFAYEILGKAGLPTAPMGDFFDRMAEIVGESDRLTSHLASHPDLKLRGENARRASKFKDGDFEPVLNAQEWAALQDICSVKATPKEATTKDEDD